MPKNMMRSFVWLLTVAIGIEWANAQSVIPVGAGSYASFPPPQANAGGTPNSPTSYLVASDGKPIPSNKWWTDLITHQYAGNMWAYPLTVSADAQGISIYNPVNWVPSANNPQLALDAPITIRGQDFAPADARALSWGDWTVAFRMQEATNKFMDVTFGHGLPTVWVELTGVQPQIAFPAGGATFFGDNGSAVSFPVTTNHFGVAYGSGRFWGVFAPDGTQFTLSNGVLNVIFAANTNNFLVLSALPAKANLAYFAQYAYAVPRDSQMNWNYDPSAGEVTTSWHLATHLLKGSEPRVIQGWLAHHWRETTHNLAFNGMNYSTARGPLKCAAGNAFEIVYPFNGILPNLPAPTTSGVSNDYNPARMNALIASVAANQGVAVDTYWGGKDLVRYAQHMAFAHELDRPEFGTLKNTVRSALTNWFTYTPGEPTYYFAAYPEWKALVGFKSSYGSEQFNDHHFHYGYFTHAAALLGMYDRDFLDNYGAMARLVAKEYANWDRGDTNFPFLRTFDVWAGYSQANGFPDAGRGGNQESSSEAVQSWAGLFLLGAVSGDDAMRAAGAMGYVMESTATREYWFNEYGDVWPPVYNHGVVGILWNNGLDFQTYFGLNPIYIYGIQWFPISPMLSYLVHNPAFARTNYNRMLAEQLSRMGANSISSMGAQWGNHALGYALQFDPDSVAAQLGPLWVANDPVATDPNYAGATYYFTHATRKLGAIQPAFHVSTPMSTVYYNSNTSQFSYVAYNPLTNSQTATIYSNGVAVGSVILPPATLTTQNPSLTNGVAFATNLVSASVAQGVAIAWPTAPNSNYLVQAANDLTSASPWTNLAGPIVGDGTTNQHFDSVESDQHKFYRVLQTP
jgi:endoglucanase Acf2